QHELLPRRVVAYLQIPVKDSVVSANPLRHRCTLTVCFCLILQKNKIRISYIDIPVIRNLRSIQNCRRVDTLNILVPEKRIRPHRCRRQDKVWRKTSREESVLSSNYAIRNLSSSPRSRS